MHDPDRLHALDAVRGFALLLGIVLHATMSFLPGFPPGLWAIVDTSPSTALGLVFFVTHIFRMALFFFIAGFFARMSFHRKGNRRFWVDRSKRILLPLIVGWMVLFPAMAVVWIWGLRKTFGDTMPEVPPGASAPGVFPLGHLWFLYYLLMLYVVVVLGRHAVVALDRSGRIREAADRLVRASVRSGAAAVLLALPLSLALYFRGDWLVWFGIPTPDQTVIPQWIPLLGYGTALAFGWLVQRQPDLLPSWGRQWPGHLAAATGATAFCLWTSGLRPSFAPIDPGFERLAAALGYGVALWSWTFAFVGLALRFMSGESRARRYVADSSYWLYLVHLPTVAAIQVAVGHQPWHWSVKFPLILAGAFALLFLSYHYLVRYTFIGAVLNGRKLRPARRRPDPPPTGAGRVSLGEPRLSDAEPSHSLATLEGVHKRYGKTIALAGLDLEVRRGELLALLGPNGAGKSTAVSLWLGLLEPDQGRVALLGRAPSDVEARREVGVMMQEVGLTPELRVRELVDLAASGYPAPLTAEEAMTLTKTTTLAERPYGKLSAGQKRQAQFAIAICGRPRLLFLDEPTVGLDVEARETIWATIRALVGQGCSIVLTTHYLEEAEALADRVAVLAEGRLIALDSVARIRALVAQKRIRCSSALTADEVRAWPDVMSASQEADRLHIAAIDAEAVVRRLLAADDQVRDLEVRPANLAEAFAELTRKAA